MKKKDKITTFWLRAMRITGAQILMVILLTSVAMARGSAQEMLQKRISITFDNASLPAALEQLSEKAGVDITFNSKVLPKSGRVFDTFQNETFGNILTRLLSPYNVSYTVVEDQVILRSVQKERKKLLSPLPFPAEVKFPGERRITGKVSDENGEGLPGVSILVKGTQQGTSSDGDGEFALEVSDDNVVLVLSFVGYDSREIAVGNRSRLTIALQVAEKALEEVVVVGYGVQKKSDLTGSVSSIAAHELEHLPVSSFDRALQGRAAGVQVTQTSGQPGAAISVRIRGGNSISGGNEPLYVIDGFPVYNNSSDISSGVVSGPSINALASVSANDIESIHILKDASATAIYGSRGANGVVIITTKKGKAGKNSIAYESYYGLQKVVGTVPVLTSSREFAFLKNEARVNAGKAPAFTPDQLANMTGGTDWQKAAFRTAPIKNHQLSISGGDDKTRYALSGNYFKQDGILLNTDFERFSGRFNFDRNFSSKFKVGVNLNMSKFSSQIANNDVVRGVLLMPPIVPIWDENGVYIYQSAFETPLGNPIATLVQETNHTTTYRLLGNIYGEYTLSPGLTAKVSFGTDVMNNKQNRYVPSTVYQGVNASTNGTARVGGKFVTTWLNENTLTYAKTIDERHSFDLLAGFTQQAYQNETVTAGSQQFINDLLTYNNLGSGSIYTAPSSGAVDWSLKSYLGRLNYAFSQKYYLTVSFRADGSSRFGKGNKWGYFPSAAFAWNVSHEDFLTLPDFISNVKMRASAGVTGNQEIGQYLSLATLSNSTYFFGDQIVTGFSPNRISNPYLGWETTAQYDGGMDLSLFRNRIDIVLDYYYKKTTNLLLNIPIPYTTGQSTSVQNYGSLENKGVEVGINFRTINSTFNWTSGLVFSLNSNKILSLGDDADYIISDASIAKVGEPLGSFYGYRTNGIFQSQDEITNNPTIDPLKTKPGDQRYQDIGGPDGIPDGKISQTYDRVVIGNAQPKFQGGFTNSFSYKNFDLTIFFQGSYGNQLFNENKQQLESLSGQQNASVSVLDRWTPENPGNVIPRAFEDPSVTNSDRFVEDGSFLRLKNLTLGYTLPSAVASRVRLTHIKFYIAAQNIFTWTNYSGYDPEVSRNGQNTLTQGIDYSVYPNNKSCQAGIAITF